jgi:hypothetical protein
MSDPAITFGAADGFGAITGLELIDDTPSESTDRARALGSIGQEVAKKLKNTLTKFTSVYILKSDTNGIAALLLGGVLNSRLITKIQIDTDNGEEANKVTIEGHQHAVNPHIDDRYQVAIGVTCNAFGAMDFLGGTGGAAASPSNGSITFECQHTDKTDKDGDHLVGENYDGMVTASTTWEGVPTTPADAAIWDVTTKDSPIKNTDFKTTVVNGTKTIALA